MIATIGRARTLRKSHAAAAGHAFVGPGRYRRRCRGAASLACDGFMQNEPVLTTALEVQSLRKSYGSVQAVRDISFTVAAGRDRRPARAERGRQDHHAGDPGGLPPPRRGRGRGPGPGPRRPGHRPRAARADRAGPPGHRGRALPDPARDPGQGSGLLRPAADVAEVIAWPGWPGWSGARSGRFSGGQKRRLDLALGLIGNPELLFLDEPTTGFDAAARRDAWQLVRDLRAAGTTILLTTHDMDEAQALADRVVVVAGGLVVAAGTPSAIGGARRRAGSDHLRAARRLHGRRPAAARRPSQTAGRGGGRRPDPRRCTG